ncbi:hypothetical protein XELAEV_18047648mg [Xenopus laevis]|uniref:C3H1-type domain-containing protein n=1 Tax=Xenopus laevis TaxID=8355 RepID=A0A974BW72_XENLA|nr:hypothetical protein XELAEV_18047648mg [Xenopus laevis]
MADLEALIEKLRAEAQKRGGEWLRWLIPEGEPEAAQAVPRRSRRARAPTRRSPSPVGRKRGTAATSPSAGNSSGHSSMEVDQSSGGEGRRRRSASPQPSTSAASTQSRAGRSRRESAMRSGVQSDVGSTASQSGAARQQQGDEAGGLSRGQRQAQASARDFMAGPSAMGGITAGPNRGGSAPGAMGNMCPRESDIWQGTADQAFGPGTPVGGNIGGRASVDASERGMDGNRLETGPQQGQVMTSGSAVGGEMPADQSGMALPPLLSFQVPGAESSGCQSGAGPVQDGRMSRSQGPGTDPIVQCNIPLNMQIGQLTTGGVNQQRDQSTESFMDPLRQLFSQWQKGQGSQFSCRTEVNTPGAVGEASTAGAPAAANKEVVNAPGVQNGGSTAGSVSGTQGETNSGDNTKDKKLPLSDSAKSNTYVCFEGPLGAHLKPEVREKIWKREYVDIFTLLPLERFGIDRYEKGKEHRKEEDEERRRFRLIPRTFGNWLQAFSILASVVGEKHSELCSALFCYLDGIWEAHKVYGGLAWLRYDEQFRQRMAVRTDLNWDHRDIGLWMRLMNTKGYQGYGGSSTTTNQPFQGGTGGHSVGSAGGHKKGVCWLFNDSQCKWGSSCRFRHECSWCAGNHPGSRCFKKPKGAAPRTREGFGKGGDASDSRSDGPVAK